MINANIADFENKFLEYLNQVVEFNEVITVNTENGNVVIISEDNYNGLIETL